MDSAAMLPMGAYEGIKNGIKKFFISKHALGINKIHWNYSLK